LLPELRGLLGRLSVRDRVPQIELAIGDDGDVTFDVLVLRHLAPLGEADRRELSAFEQRHHVHFYLQAGGPDTARVLSTPSQPITYRLPDFNVVLEFDPTDFTQVNASVNRVLVRRAIALLDPHPGEHVADFFCGIGNFTLPIARRGASVVGLEGSRALVSRAEANAARNGLSDRARFESANLFEACRSGIETLGPLDKALVDPPREGAIALVKALPEKRLERIVYVSCNPATLARDAAVLVHERGYALRAAGIVNMFPHTAHVESIAVFEG